MMSGDERQMRSTAIFMAICLIVVVAPAVGVVWCLLQ